MDLPGVRENAPGRDHRGTLGTRLHHRGVAHRGVRAGVRAGPDRPPVAAARTGDPRRIDGAVHDPFAGDVLAALAGHVRAGPGRIVGDNGHRRARPVLADDPGPG